MNLREKLLAKSSFKYKVVEIPDGPDGETLKVLIRGLSIAQKNDLLGDVDTATGKIILGSARTNRLTAHVIIQCALDPDTSKPLFADTDEALLLDSPANSWVETLAQEILALAQESSASAKN